MDRTKSHTHTPVTYVKVDHGEKLLNERISRKTFVRLGALLGVGTAGASVLACAGSSGSGGSNDGSSGGSGENAASGGPSVSSDKKIVSRAKEQASDSRAIARAPEVRPGTAMKFEDSGGNPAMLVHLSSGKFVAYSAVCPHEGCTVAYRNGKLACPCHGAIFDPANNARVVIGTAQRPLLKIPVEVRGGAVVRA
jgi:cytochrome b6-f complex iron-sulfur subunit